MTAIQNPIRFHLNFEVFPFNIERLLGKVHQVTHLEVSTYEHMNKEKIQMLATPLEQFQHVASLDFTSSFGAGMLAPSIQKLTSLVNLSLTNTYLGKRGMKALASALS